MMTQEELTFIQKAKTIRFDCYLITPMFSSSGVLKELSHEGENGEVLLLRSLRSVP